MRDLLVFAIVVMSLPLAFRRPFFGLLLFSWLAYMRPQDLCWGFARGMRFSFFAGVTMIAGWFAHERGIRPFARWDVRSQLMTLLLVLVGISLLLARDSNPSQLKYTFEFVKIIVVALFTTGQVDNPRRFRIMLWTIALCLAFYGVKSGLLGLVRGGSRILRGPGGMLEDNNDFALALVMNIPLLWYLGMSERGMPWVRTATRIAVALTVLAIALTHSRGAFVALAATALWIAWRSGRLLQAAMGLTGIAVAFLMLAPQHVLDRLATIGEGAQESSAGARLVAWRTALRMIEDNPLFGVGIRSFHLRYGEYAVVPIDPKRSYVAHNSYLQVWAESGTLAFLVYLALLLSVFVACGRVRRMAFARPHLAWANDYARMMEATTMGAMVGATFLNRGHFDLIYHWLALVTCLLALTAAAYRTWQAPAQRVATGVSTRWRLVTSGLPRWGRAAT